MKRRGRVVSSVVLLIIVVLSLQEGVWGIDRNKEEKDRLARREELANVIKRMEQKQQMESTMIKNKEEEDHERKSTNSSISASFVPEANLNSTHSVSLKSSPSILEIPPSPSSIKQENNNTEVLRQLYLRKIDQLVNLERNVSYSVSPQKTLISFIIPAYGYQSGLYLRNCIQSIQSAFLQIDESSSSTNSKPYYEIILVPTINKDDPSGKFKHNHHKHILSLTSKLIPGKEAAYHSDYYEYKVQSSYSLKISTHITFNTSHSFLLGSKLASGEFLQFLLENVNIRSSDEPSQSSSYLNLLQHIQKLNYHQLQLQHQIYHSNSNSTLSGNVLYTQIGVLTPKIVYGTEDIIFSAGVDYMLTLNSGSYEEKKEPRIHLNPLSRESSLAPSPSQASNTNYYSWPNRFNRRSFYNNNDHNDENSPSTSDSPSISSTPSPSAPISIKLNESRNEGANETNSSLEEKDPYANVDDQKNIFNIEEGEYRHDRSNVILPFQRFHGYSTFNQQANSRSFYNFNNENNTNTFRFEKILGTTTVGMIVNRKLFNLLNNLYGAWNHTAYSNEFIGADFSLRTLHRNLNFLTFLNSSSSVNSSSFSSTSLNALKDFVQYEIFYTPDATLEFYNLRNSVNHDIFDTSSLDSLSFSHFWSTSPILNNYINSTYLISNLSLFWNMECATGAVLGFTTEAIRFAISLYKSFPLFLEVSDPSACKSELTKIGIPGEWQTIINRLTHKRQMSSETNNSTAKILVLHRDPGRYSSFLSSRETGEWGVEEFNKKIKAEYIVGRSMYETDGIPQGWREAIEQNVNEVWVPSHFGRDVFGDSINESIVYVLPEPVDVHIFDPNQTETVEYYGDEHDQTQDDARMETTQDKGKKDKMKVMTMMKFEKRKGWDLLLQSWVQEFNENDNVQLKMYVKFSSSDKSEIISYISSLLHNKTQILPVSNLTQQNPIQNFSKEEILQHGKIEMIGEMVPGHLQPGVLKSMDGFILPSRGEGWGLPLIEAMAMQLPTIGTYWSGNTEFMNENNSFLVPVEKLELVDERSRSGQKWARASVPHMRKALRALYEYWKNPKFEKFYYNSSYTETKNLTNLNTTQTESKNKTEVESGEASAIASIGVTISERRVEQRGSCHKYGGGRNQTVEEYLQGITGEKMRRIIENGRRTVVEEFSLEGIRGKVVELLKELVEKRFESGKVVTLGRRTGDSWRRNTAQSGGANWGGTSIGSTATGTETLPQGWTRVKIIVDT